MPVVRTAPARPRLRTASRTQRGPKRCPGGPHGTAAYTPAMRRWVCIIALLAGFAGQGYVWTVRPRIPVPIERVLDPATDPLGRTSGWWLDH